MADWVTRYRIDGDSPHDLPADTAAALRQLAEGNERFCAEAGGDPFRDPASPFQQTPPRQAPFGVVLGCSDARVPLEIVFDASPNELFVVRVAGNVLGDESLG